MTTAGELLRALSGLTSATAGEHLLASEVGEGGVGYPVFGTRFSVTSSEHRDWAVAQETKTYLFVEAQRETLSPLALPSYVSNQQTDQELSLRRATEAESVFLRLAQQRPFVRVERERIFIRVQ